MSQARPSDAEIDAYAQRWILKNDQTAAFRAAFPKSKAKPETLYSKASTFNKMEQVQERIAELQAALKKKTEDEFGLSTGKLKMMLATAVTKGLKDKTDAQGNKVAVSIPGAVSAIAEINKMDGNHAPTKITTPPGEPLEFKLSDLTPEELTAAIAKYGLTT